MNHFSIEEVNSLFEVLKTIANSSSSSNRDNVIELITDKLPNYDSNKVLKQLMDYSILILIDEDDKLYFNYRDNDLETVDFSKLYLTCHKAIFRYFNPERR